MSAFIVSDEVINKIVAGLKLAAINGDRFNASIAKPWQLPTLEVNNIEQAIRLGNQLFEMNIDAVNQRYGDGAASQFRVLNYKYIGVMPPDIFQFLKSIDCLLYQCSEGNVPDTNLLYKELEKYSYQLCSHIVHGLAEYEQARWA